MSTSQNNLRHISSDNYVKAPTESLKKCSRRLEKIGRVPCTGPEIRFPATSRD
jgi:hypothetical protein